MSHLDAMPAVHPISATELSGKLVAVEDDLTLVDVRTRQERSLARIEGSVLLDGAVRQELQHLPKDRMLVFYCHHGVRSLRVASYFVDQGFCRVYNLSGGIAAWSRDVDPSVSTY